jgi:diguanylate cyclase (GGDEF)-like protein
MARILIVDDEVVIAQDILRSLIRMGHAECICAHTAVDAIQKAVEEAPDLILMDIKLGRGGDGIEAATRIVSLMDVPIVYLTSYSDEEILHRARITAPFGYLIKPFEEKLLHATIEMALYKSEMERKLKETAQHDELTGLPSRRLFFDRLEDALLQARRYVNRLAVLFIDLNRFKTVNDTLGHAAGDAILKETAARLRTCVRESDTVSRVGGDEFTILLSKINEPEDAAGVAVKVISAMSLPFEVKGQLCSVCSVCSVGAAVGISLFPEDGTDVETLVGKADKAMYSVKARGEDDSRGVDDYCFYSLK